MTTYHPITLHEDEQSKLVQLNGEYYTDFGCSINELKAAFYATGYVELHRFKNSDPGEVTRFTLTEAEANAFVAAWETFQAEQALKKLAEEKRLQTIIEEAHAMLKGLPVIVEDHPETNEVARYWKVRSDVLHLDMIAYTAENFKTRAERAVEEHQRYLRSQAIHDEVKALKIACPAIKIHSQHAPWHVVIESPEIYGEFARTPEELLEKVQAAKAKYEQWQVEQARELVKDLPITIEEYPDPVGCCLCWAISSTEAGFSLSPPKLPCVAYDTEQLMRFVEDAKTKYERWQAEQDIQQQQEQNDLIKYND